MPPITRRLHAPDTPPAARGRPRTITRERIADAGIAVGLPNVSFVNVAAALGVSHMALYKRVESLEALKLMVAEEIFTRWPVPHAGADTHPELRDYRRVGHLLRDMVKTHPGLAPYLLRPSVTTQPMMAKIHGHQTEVARVYGVSPDQARVLLATVAFHCIAVADTVYSVAGKSPQPGRTAPPRRPRSRPSSRRACTRSSSARWPCWSSASRSTRSCSRRGNRPGAMKNAARIAPGGVLLSQRDGSVLAAGHFDGGSRTAS